MTDTATNTEVETKASENPTVSERRTEVGARHLSPAAIRTARETLKCSRSALSELTGLPTSRIWAAEQDDKTISDEHYAVIVAALENVKNNGLPAHLQPKQGAPKKAKTAGPTALEVELAQRLFNVRELLDGALAAKTLKDIRAIVEQARTIAYEKTGESGEFEPNSEEQGTEEPVTEVNA